MKTMSYKVYGRAILLAVMLLGHVGVSYAQDSMQVQEVPNSLRNLTSRVSGDISLTVGINRVQDPSLTGVRMEKAQAVNLMDKGEQCMEYSWSPKGKPCCRWKMTKKGPVCLPGMWGGRYDINYWEPSEIIEVSCRTGYSMLAPGSVPSRLAGHVQGDGKLPQSCFGFNRPGNQRWFFEARVWAINGYDGKLRHQAMGGTNGERARQCTLEGRDLPWGGLPNGKYWGYGKKWLEFSRGAANGPEGSWEAYMSDTDPNWALESSGAAGGSLSACRPGSSDLQNCWGPVTRNGWVTHSNPKVAAALVAWRAHEMAQGAGKASPASTGGGFQMMMDYPYLEYAGSHGASMGMKNGGKTGSQCFRAGDAGPEWYGGMTPSQIPGEVMKLTSGTLATAAEINPGVYIFTIWVKTKCIRYDGMREATSCCHYDFENGMMTFHPACRV